MNKFIANSILIKLSVIAVLTINQNAREKVSSDLKTKNKIKFHKFSSFLSFSN